MPRCKTLMLIAMILGRAFALLALVAGFVPQREGPEVRRQVSNYVVSLRPQDMPVPIVGVGEGERLWAVRAPVSSLASATTAPQGEALPETGTLGRIVAFDKDGVRLGMGEDELNFSLAAVASDLSPLLAMDGVSMPLLVTSQPRQYGDALDGEGRPLRWLPAHTLLAGYMPVNPKSAPGRSREEGILPESAYFESGSLMSKARRYQQLVEDFGRRYDLDTDLIYAIIHSESDFSPSLVSNKSAMGLMQLLPSTASDEVHRFLYGRPGSIGFDDLRQPEINIRFGTAYLHILQTRYFSGVRDVLSREYCTVAAYNMGPNRFMRLYGQSNEEAVARINGMSNEELYHDLTRRLPIRETRFYVAKVRRMKDEFAELR